MAANKKSTGGHVIYDSGTDVATGKKRAVLPGGGGVSVAERARMFGAQVAHSSPAKAYNAATHVPERPPLSNQSNRSNAIQQERNYPPPRADVDRRPKQNSSYSNPQRTFNAHHSAVDLKERTKREQIPSSARGAHTYNYSKAPSNYNTHLSQSPPRRRPNNSYDSFQRVSPQRPPTNKPRHTQRMPSDSYSSEEEDTYSALYDNPPSSRHPHYQPSNYFRPIKDPLEVLFKDSPKEYIQFQAPVRQPPKDTSHLQPFDLGSLINRIQQDYIDNARPYVSSVQFVQHNQSLADVGFLTPAVNRKDYSKRAGDNYHRQAPMSNHYDVIDANGLYPYEKMDPRGYYVDNNYSSIRRRRHHRRYHNQASSPIHILETSSKTTTEPKAETPPVSSSEKAPTPPVASTSEEEDEDKKDESTQQDATKTAEEDSTEEESEEGSEEGEEEEEEEEKSAPAPALPPPISAVNGTSRFVPSGNSRPPGPYQTPTLARNQPEPSETEESDSDESESESDSDSDGNKKKKKKKKVQQPIAASSPAARSNPLRTAQATPQTNARSVAQRGNYEKTSLNQLQESSSTVGPIEILEPEKSGSIGGKLKSFTSKFRRNKS